MAKYRHDLPQLQGDLFLTDGGIETTLIFHDGLELPDFAAFDLLRQNNGVEALQRYFRTYAAIAKKHGVGFIFESPTWRASLDWGEKLGYSKQALMNINHEAIELLMLIRDEYECDETKMVISGCIGPRGDGYNADSMMAEAAAEQYHQLQARVFHDAGADMITAITMTHAEEATGLVRAAMAVNMPVVISYTVETDGRLPSGQLLKDAIDQVDIATDKAPVYYMINCAHPTHFSDALAPEPWMQRIRGIRANASKKSHAELDEAEALDEGNPVELGTQYRALRNSFNHINVLGGCCGTDHRHIEAISSACLH